MEDTEEFSILKGIMEDALEFIRANVCLCLIFMSFRFTVTSLAEASAS